MTARPTPERLQAIRDGAVRLAARCGAVWARDLTDLLEEIDALTAERDEARANYRFMVERAADEKLDGYRELGARAAAAENEADRLRATIARLEAVAEAARFYCEAFARHLARTGGHEHAALRNVDPVGIACALSALQASDAERGEGDTGKGTKL